MGRDAVIVAAVRTPVGKRNGGLSDMHAADLSAIVLNALMERAGVDPDVVDDVAFGIRQHGRRRRGPGVATRAAVHVDDEAHNYAAESGGNSPGTRGRRRSRTSR